MKKEHKIINVFLSSPSDVKEERDICMKIVNEINYLLCDTLGIAYVIHSSDSLTPTLVQPNHGVQDIINNAIPMEEIDVYIGVLWLRMGTPTKEWRSGTEEEFWKAYELWQQNGTPTIYVYHNISIPTINANKTQLKKVNDFFKEFNLGGSHPGYIKNYESHEEFEDSLKSNLVQFMIDKYNHLQENENEISLCTNTRLEKRGIHKFFVPKEKREQRTEDKNISMKNSNRIRLMAHAGYSYLSRYANRMYPQVKDCLDNGCNIEIIFTNPYSQSGYLISVADEDRYPKVGEDIINFIEESSWIKEKQVPAIKEYKNLKKIYGSLIQIKMLGFDMSSTILLTDNMSFIEPYAFSEMGEKDMSTFEIEFSKDSYLFGNLNEYFDTLWRCAENFEEFENKIDFYKNHLRENWMFF